MTLFRRLCLCLFALALLPGAPLQAHRATVVAPPLAAATAAHGGCHEAMPQATVSGPAVAAAGAGPAKDCCGDGGHGAAGCGSDCACPAASTSALPPPSPALRAGMPQRQWNAARVAGRPGPADGPPRRPPIG